MLLRCWYLEQREGMPIKRSLMTTNDRIDVIVAIIREFEVYHVDKFAKQGVTQLFGGAIGMNGIVLLLFYFHFKFLQFDFCN